MVQSIESRVSSRVLPAGEQRAPSCVQQVALVALLAAVWQHASAAERAFSYSRQSVSGPPVVGPAQKIAVRDPHGQGQDSYDYVAHPQYRNAYEVADPHSGDFHMHEEQREGDAVKGSYRLHDADGRIRTVHYTADAGGYRAQVSYSSPGSVGVGGGSQHARAPAPAPAAHEGRHEQGVLVPPPVPAHAQVHQPARPAPVHEQQPLGPSAAHADHLRQHRAHLAKHQQRVRHHAQHHAHLAEAQGLAHLQQ
ncbi:Cuticle Protein RR-2 58 [Gryllus bimaculatus]|nr:Cuticle Protein RR-2 58 [Gryllus bimaculatus]